MTTPMRTICRPVPLCISLAAVAIAAAGAQANPLTARLHVFPYEAPFGPDVSPVLASPPSVP